MTTKQLQKHNTDPSSNKPIPVEGGGFRMVEGGPVINDPKFAKPFIDALNSIDFPELDDDLKPIESK